MIGAGVEAMLVGRGYRLFSINDGDLTVMSILARHPYPCGRRGFVGTVSSESQSTSCHSATLHLHPTYNITSRPGAKSEILVAVQLGQMHGSRRTSQMRQ